jgi:hypothetical protein
MDNREFENFLNSRGADRDCPACGYDGAWATVDADHPLRIPAVEADASIRVAALLCTNCGFVRLHALGVIRDELVEREEPPTDL